MPEQLSTRQTSTGPKVPSADELVSSPLRHRIHLELDAPGAEVWALVGDVARFPEYSAGLDRVEATWDATGGCTEYLCHFEPREVGGPGIDHRELIRWYEPNHGFASSAEEPNAFGLVDALTLVILEPMAAGTRLTWEQYYQAEEPDMMRAEFDGALLDIAGNLIARFGGRTIDRHDEP